MKGVVAHHESVVLITPMADGRPAGHRHRGAHEVGPYDLAGITVMPVVTLADSTGEVGDALLADLRAALTGAELLEPLVLLGETPKEIEPHLTPASTSSFASHHLRRCRPRVCTPAFEGMYTPPSSAGSKPAGQRVAEKNARSRKCAYPKGWVYIPSRGRQVSRPSVNWGLSPIHRRGVEPERWAVRVMPWASASLAATERPRPEPAVEREASAW